MWVAIVVLCSSCYVPVGGPFGSGKSRKQAQHDVLAEFTPPGLDTDPVSSAQVKDVRVRVWADDEYRSQNTSWERTCQQAFDEANKVLVAKLRMRLVPDYQVWNYRAPTGATLSERLLELVKQDEGDDVFAVIGFTGSLAIVEATFEELGVAHIGGRHMVMRGYADIEERKAFRDAFPDLPKQEIERSHALRRLHKTASVLLHELGHNLGVDHESAPDTMMNGGYSHNTTGFSDQALATMRGNIALHQGAPQAIPVANAQPASAPKSSHQTGQPAKSGNSIQLIVTAQGQVMLGGNILVGAQLRETLESSPKIDPGIELVIQRALHAPQAAVDDLKMRAQKAGFVYISTVP